MLKVAGIFSQILGEISLTNFEKLVIKHGAERHAKGLKCPYPACSDVFLSSGPCRFPEGDMPRSFVSITEANVHDVKVARTPTLTPDSIVAMDRAYIDFELMNKWNV
jgi:hypothetical protein